MTRRKGLSQILYLIIAASVLMMVALSLIFMFNSSVGGSTGDVSACRTAASTQCSVTPSNAITAPSSCLKDGQPLQQADFVKSGSEISNFEGDYGIVCDDVE